MFARLAYLTRRYCQRVNPGRFNIAIGMPIGRRHAAPRRRCALCCFRGRGVRTPTTNSVAKQGHTNASRRVLILFSGPFSRPATAYPRSNPNSKRTDGRLRRQLHQGRWGTCA
eukprot:2010207-Pleurochrysis_carterae.AAC.1